MAKGTQRPSGEPIPRSPLQRPRAGLAMPVIPNAAAKRFSGSQDAGQATPPHVVEAGSQAHLGMRDTPDAARNTMRFSPDSGHMPRSGAERGNSKEDASASNQYNRGVLLARRRSTRSGFIE